MTKEPQTSECVICGERYFKTVWNKMTCSVDCKHELQRRASLDRYYSMKGDDYKEQEVKCAHEGCKNTFIIHKGGRGRTRKFCSKACKDKTHDHRRCHTEKRFDKIKNICYTRLSWALDFCPYFENRVEIIQFGGMDI